MPDHLWLIHLNATMWPEQIKQKARKLCKKLSHNTQTQNTQTNFTNDNNFQFYADLRQLCRIEVNSSEHENFNSDNRDTINDRAFNRAQRNRAPVRQILLHWFRDFLDQLTASAGVLQKHVAHTSQRNVATLKTKKHHNEPICKVIIIL